MNFDNKKHGSEQDTIKINLNNYEAKTVTLNANGGTVDNKAEQVYTYKVRSGRRDSFSLLRDRFNLSSHTPVRAGYEFTGWYADKACTKLVSAAGSDQMQNSSERFVEDGLLVSELSPEAREALELVEKLQYYRMRDMEVD